MTALSIRGLRVRYNGTEVLSGIDLDVEKGAWLGVVGPNGSGKTSLLRGVVGTVPINGKVEIERRDLSELSSAERSRSIAVVAQRPNLPPDMTVFDYVLLGRTPHISYFGVEGRTDLQVVVDVLERLELGGLSFRSLGSLSGGESQLVALARSLAQEAPILLLDEPTSALDVGHQQQVLELVDELRAEQALTVISALHDLTLAAQFCDRLIMLGSGVVQAAGEPRDVLTVENIESLYGASVRVIQLDGGEVAVVPRRTGG
ncbi:MAG: ABC transporter ATP-binding protein [Acidimicrobiia bacterium]|nr:ABC transporter ATP-binding protein [Acidimicrobiia bacterium]